MITLLVVIYVSFIALGLPDAMLGVAWPVIYQEMELPISLAGLISMTVSGCTVVSSLFSSRLVCRFGTGLVTAVSTLLTLAALFGFAYSPNIVCFFLLAVPLGLGAGAIDSGLNSFVALHYSAAQMNFLQCFYGIGVIISPYLMSLALGDSENWRQGYLSVAGIQTVLAVMTLAALPLWKKMERRAVAEDGVQPRVLTLGQMLKMPAVRWTCMVFFVCCGVELTFGGWSSTYFVHAKDVSPQQAARITMLFYVGLTVGRFLGGVLAGKLTPRQTVWISGGLLLGALVVLVLPVGTGLAAAALLVAGVGVGPLFPNLTLLTPENFGRDVAQSLIGLQMSATYLGIMLMPPLFGFLAENISVSAFPWFQLVLHGICMVGFGRLCKVLEKQRKNLAFQAEKVEKN